MSGIIEGYSYDIFISYRQKDNKYDGWVTEFVENLKRELDSMFKDEVTVYFDINPSDYLLETYDVDASLKDKLKCLVFIPVISRTYCDPRSFAWEYEFKAFINVASQDKFGLKIKLPNGNITSRLLPVRINDLDPEDTKLCETASGGVFRGIDFIYKEPGVNRPLRSNEENPHDNLNHTIYRNQINKVSLAIREIIESLKTIESEARKRKEHDEQGESKKEQKTSDAIEKTLKKETERKKEVLPQGEKKGSPRSKVPGLIMISSGIISILVVASLLLYNHSRKKWARETALPKMEQSFNELNVTQAFDLLQQIRRYLPDDTVVKSWSSRIAQKVTMITDPPGADVYVREYSNMEGEWEKLGITPIEGKEMPWFTLYQVRLVKNGYDTVIAAIFTNVDTLSRKLFESGKIPQGMSYIDGYYDEVKNSFEENYGFFMDKYEVTNRQYKEFVDNGGYRKKEYWKIPFTDNGKTLDWEDAMARFIDKTGRPGPSTWEAGDYPDGQDNYPVSGVSWYEAAAYADFSGKDLPTGDHWDSGAGFYWRPFYDNIGSKICPLSNFSTKGTEPVGKNPGLTSFGLYDMAGNVREWNWNQTATGHLISGAGYDDATYLFASWNQLPAFDRSPQNGFRCVKYIEKEKIPQSAFRLVEVGRAGRDFTVEAPVPDNIFNVYRNQFLYDSTSLDPVIDETHEKFEDWTVQKISISAAYNNERMTVYLYLPENAPPPFQTIIFFPGSYAMTSTKYKIDDPAVKWFFDFILKSGRAVAYPVYKGTFERKLEQYPPQSTHQYTDWMIKMVKDFKRTVDYLETRQDIDADKLGFYGHSWGGMLGGIIPAVEERLKANILIVGGFISNAKKAYPEADIINYVPRIKIPTLMLNGRYDYRFNVETNLKPFHKLLGTPENDKRLVVYNTDHYVAKSDMIMEVLGWCDRYLGPVNSK